MPRFLSAIKVKTRHKDVKQLRVCIADKGVSIQLILYYSGNNTGLVNIQRYLNTHHNKKRNSVSEQITNKNIEN